MVAHASMMMLVRIIVMDLNVNQIFHCGADVLVIAFIHENAV
jgi:hypothetical protein